MYKCIIQIIDEKAAVIYWAESDYHRIDTNAYEQAKAEMTENLIEPQQEES